MVLFKNIKLVVLLLFLQQLLFSQSTCGSAQPFCANQGAVSFSAGLNTSAQTGPNYGCLFSQPNPAWYYFQVSNSGNIIIDIAGSGGFDVDFIAWGPFTSPNTACGNLTGTNDVDCSFSSSPTETCVIPNAISGQYYMLLITNFSNQPQNINFSQTQGTGSTNCGLLNSSVNSQSICPGNSATITATSSFTNPTYLWSNGATTQSIIVSPTATTVYSVTISGLDATGTSTNISNTSTVTVFTLPALALTTNSNVCPGSNINLTASTGYTTYAWTGPSGYSQNTTTGLSTITNATNAMSGTYTVIATTANGCTNTATGSVSVVTTSSVLTTPTISICEGGTINLTANALGASSYSWAGPNAYNSAQQNPSINPVTLNQAGVYTVSAIYAQGNASCASKGTTTLTVIASAPATLSTIAPICNEGTINLIAPNGGNAYLWAGPNSFTSTLQNPTINNASIAEVGIYTVVITNNGCVNTGTVNITVYDVLSYSVFPTNTTVCFGKTTTISASAIGGSGSYNYSWLPNIGLSNANNPTTQVTGSATTIYTITVSDSNCGITTPASTTVEVVVNPIPIISFSTSNARGCEPFCTDLISNSTPPSANCEWKFNNTLSYNACNTNTFCFGTHGTYNAKLTITDINGCVDSLKQISFVVVDPKPIPDFEWTEPNPNIINNEVKFFDKSTLGSPMTDWKWIFDDAHSTLANDTSILKNPVHTYDYVGKYTVSLVVINSFGCQDTVYKTVTVEDDFAIYIPNAFSPENGDGQNDVFKVAGSGFLPETFDLAIYDRWGALVYKTNDVSKGWDGTIKGKAAKQDVYIYKIKLKDYKNRSKEFVGHLTLL